MNQDIAVSERSQTMEASTNSQPLDESPATSLSLHSSPIGDLYQEEPLAISGPHVDAVKAGLPASSRFVQLRVGRLPKAFEIITICPVIEAQVDLRQSWLQDKACTSSYCKSFFNRIIGQCAACTTRDANSGGCRFHHLRRITTDRAKQDTVHVLVNNPGVTDLSRRICRPSFSITGTKHDANFLMRIVKVPLQAILEREKEHDLLPHILRRSRDEYTRNICDGCATTIFSSHFICYVCGRELCLECFDDWDDSIDAMEYFVHLNRCTTRKGQARQLHTKLQMLPSTRFGSDDLGALQHKLASIQSDESLAGPGQRMEDFIPYCDVSEGLPYAAAEFNDITLARFQAHWTSGQPLRLSGFKDRFNIDWTPDYFIEQFGDQKTELVDVITRAVQPSTIRDFFEGLRLGNLNAMQHLKLNDWPVVDDFAVAMPDLFEDFEQALPFPIYTRRKGFLNLAAWFPPQYLPPDLGPKLYCAGASSDDVGARGTTVLHMDMTDAINIMTWAGAKPESRSGCAVWDVFNQDDSDAIRSYLLEQLQQNNPRVIMDDPIRRAQFYLDKQDLSRLADRGVVPWRIYQNPGDAVFIPAGCAHQVCNLTPCIKVACDFVCPENITRCSTIAQADRKLATHAKREDVLQLKNIIYFAFLGVQEWLNPTPVIPELQTISKEPDWLQAVLPLKRKSTSDTDRPKRRRGVRECKTKVMSYLEDDDLQPPSSIVSPDERRPKRQTLVTKQSYDQIHDLEPIIQSVPYEAQTSHSRPRVRPRKSTTGFVTEHDAYTVDRSCTKSTPGTITVLQLGQKSPEPRKRENLSAEEAFQSFVETYGFPKLAVLFAAHLTKEAERLIVHESHPS